MIRINLMPEDMRPEEGMPLARIAVTVVGLVLCGTLAYFAVRTNWTTLPDRKKEITRLQDEKKRLEAETQLLTEINGQITAITDHVEAIRNLYRNRILWAKILSDIKTIATLDPTMNRPNQDLRYLWLTRLTGGDNKLTIEGWATAIDQGTAYNNALAFYTNLRNSKPMQPPEDLEEQRLLQERRTIQLPPGPDVDPDEALRYATARMAEIDKRLEEIKNLSSGKVAMRPLGDYIGSMQVPGYPWSSVPTSRFLSSAGMMPRNGTRLNVTIQLAPPSPDELE